MSKLTERYESASTKASASMTLAKKDLATVLEGLAELSSLQPDVQEAMEKVEVESESESDLETFIEMDFDAIARKVREFEEMLDDLMAALNSIQVDI